MHIMWRHVHHQAGANCTHAKLYFWTIFQFFFYPNGTWTHPPTSKLFLDFWNFFNFAKPLSETALKLMQSYLTNRKQYVEINNTQSTKKRHYRRGATRLHLRPSSIYHIHK